MARRSLAVMVPVVLLFAGARAASAQTVDEIIAKHLIAKGGEAAMRGVTTIKQSTEMTMMGQTLVMTMMAKRPNLVRQEVNIGGQMMVTAFDGATAWLVNPLSGSTTPQPINGPESTMLKDQAQFDGPILDYKTNGTKIELAGTETINGKPAHHLRMTLKSGAVQDLYIDAATGLDVRLVMQGPAGPMIQDLADYRKVNGLMVPFSITMTMNGAVVSQVKVTSVEFNQPLDDALFKIGK